MSRKHQNICPDCGAYLDPGEPCDCRQALQEAEKRPAAPAHHAAHGQARIAKAHEKSPSTYHSNEL